MWYFAWILGLGVLFATVWTTTRSGAGDDSGGAGASVLFGSIFGLSAGRAAASAVIAAVVCLVLLLIARPLLFASLDEAVAAARGVPVRLLGYGFLVLVAVTGWGQPADKERARQAGFHRHFTKPVSETEIRRLLVEVAGDDEPA